MAEGFSSTQFNNILQDLQQDLDEQLVPALQQSTQALEALLEAARDRTQETAEQMQQALQRALELGETMRAELETFERVHLQAAATTSEALAAALDPATEATDRVQKAADELGESLGKLDSALPQFTDSVSATGDRLGELAAGIDEDNRQRSEEAAAAARSVDTNLEQQASAAEQAFANLAQSCEEMTVLSTDLSASHAALCGEQLARTAEELRNGVRDAAEAADSAAGLVLEGLEVFSGANEQMKNLFGDRSDEVLGTVRRIADLIESIRPFIDLAKSI